MIAPVLVDMPSSSQDLFLHPPSSTAAHPHCDEQAAGRSAVLPLGAPVGARAASGAPPPKAPKPIASKRPSSNPPPVIAGSFTPIKFKPIAPALPLPDIERPASRSNRRVRDKLAAILKLNQQAPLDAKSTAKEQIRYNIQQRLRLKMLQRAEMINDLSQLEFSHLDLGDLPLSPPYAPFHRRAAPQQRKRGPRAKRAKETAGYSSAFSQQNDMFLKQVQDHLDSQNQFLGRASILGSPLGELDSFFADFSSEDSMSPTRYLPFVASPTVAAAATTAEASLPKIDAFSWSSNLQPAERFDAHAHVETGWATEHPSPDRYYSPTITTTTTTISTTPTSMGSDLVFRDEMLAGGNVDQYFSKQIVESEISEQDFCDLFLVPTFFAGQQGSLAASGCSRGAL